MIRIITVLLVSLVCVGCDSLLRSDRPLSRSQVSSKVNLPLPRSADNIYYLFFAGGMQDLESYLRFDVANEEIEQAVEQIIKKANLISGQNLPYLRRSISTSDFQYPRREWMPVGWWDLDDIKQGYYRGEDVSYGVHIWVDTESRRIYVYQND